MCQSILSKSIAQAPDMIWDRREGEVGFIIIIIIIVINKISVSLKFHLPIIFKSNTLNLISLLLPKTTLNTYC